MVGVPWQPDAPDVGAWSARVAFDGQLAGNFGFTVTLPER